jgi:hypothetical protein
VSHVILTESVVCEAGVALGILSVRSRYATSTHMGSFWALDYDTTRKRSAYERRPEAFMQAVKEAERSSILTKAIAIFVEESVGEGAPTFYAIRVRRPCNIKFSTLFVHLKLQEGPDGPDGGNINGVSDVALIELLIHRSKAFQAGKLAWETNVTALVRLKDALATLLDRTAQRRAAGVEGDDRFDTRAQGYEW